MVGIGPGNPLDRTRRAEQAIAESSIVVGYKRYLEQVADLTEGKTLIPGTMRHEVERCRTALRYSLEGATVSLVSSGDSGIYGMAGLALELAADAQVPIPITVVPGVTAAIAAAARVGAPLMLDYACISLSDLLVDWATIRRRLEAVAASDLVVALYNPRSSRRVHQLEEAVEILRAVRGGTAPAAVATDVTRMEETITLADLDHLLSLDISMGSVVIVGNSTTVLTGDWLITPRGYRL